jgi:hypothetical protein
MHPVISKQPNQTMFCFSRSIPDMKKIHGKGFIMMHLTGSFAGNYKGDYEDKLIQGV